MEAQRIGTLPESELRKALDDARAEDILTTFAELIARAKPYWYTEKRKARHRAIATAAEGQQAPDHMGPFPLIYADPPWTFETYTPAGHESHRMPDDHYPVMSDAEIAAYTIGDKTIAELTAPNAALFLWCTSSNIVRALEIMKAWGFTYKTQAVWDKGQIGIGQIFRNQHEVLLYGDHGKMPKPVVIPSSVFRYPRGKHSAKPPEIRAILESMYPHFDERHRVELFARGKVEGWSVVGNQAVG
jgi:N6-adenosine-specific RNA methylase IME4